MTLIVGLVEDGKVYIGADSLIMWGSKSVQMSTNKIWKTNEMVIGGAGSLVHLQNLQYNLKIPEVPKQYLSSKNGLIKYLSTEFFPAFKTSLIRGALLEIKDSVGVTDLDILIGMHGRLFVISAQGAVNECVQGYCAIGSGSEFALGVLHTLQTTDTTPEDKILRALDAAAEHTYSVARPFSIESI
jgi:ATP-dependent protease HslVU (ClpYQ) peptidase subunit